MTHRRPLIIGIGGTTRAKSMTQNAVAETLRVAESLGARTRLFNGEFLFRIPLYDPDRTTRSSLEEEFLGTIRDCDGVVVGTPGYQGSVSGAVKNALDLLQDTAQDERPYLEDRAFGCVVAAHGWQACGTALVALRTIAHALRAWPTPYGATLNVSQSVFDEVGHCVDAGTQRQLETVASQVVRFAARAPRPAVR